MRIETATHGTLEDWAALRHALWPQATESVHREEAAALLGTPDRAVAFLAYDARGTVAGFAEAALRHDYVNGCETSPVAFLEGIYVLPGQRRSGVARLLVQAVEAWAVGLGCSELASDADIRNRGSHGMHRALGFEETERVVYFRRTLGGR